MKLAEFNGYTLYSWGRSLLRSIYSAVSVCLIVPDNQIVDFYADSLSNEKNRSEVGHIFSPNRYIVVVRSADRDFSALLRCEVVTE